MLDVFIGILTTPAVTLGFVALLGLILQKKKYTDVIKGTVKTILGLLILSAGAGVIVQNLIPFSSMFTEAFNLTGVVPFDEAVVGALIEKVEVIARTTSLILALGFVANIVLARITPFKYIFLTGHMMWIMAGAIAWAFYDLGVTEVNTIIFGTIIQGIVLLLLPTIAQPIMRKITGSDSIAYGHLTTIGVVVSAYVGKLLGNTDESSEDIKLPEGLDFFKDTAISVSLVMVVIYVITALFAGEEFIKTLAGDQNYITFSVLNGLGFAAGVLILLQGVRMFLGEIVPAFRGIGMKLVPGAKPALDCPVVFTYAPTALMLGFIFSVIGMLIGMFVSQLFGGIVPLPSIIGGFFTGGTAGIFGNATGGKRGAMVSGVMYGLFLTIPVALFYPLFGLSQYGVDGVALLVSDAIVVLSLIKLFFSIGIPYIGFGLLIALLVLLSVKFKNKKPVN
ncbi:MAG: PTS ascorbate transporter subunit IIC [Clostridia bacterium]|nr:PTS ascorbate transporter subunit IIC [Clostridia bacterium]